VTSANIQEHWRAINDFPGYQVSDLGAVRRTELLDIYDRLVYPAEIVAQCLSGSPRRHPVRYFEVSLRIAERNRKARKVHHLVCEAFHGPRPPGLHALHNDDDEHNNRADNLRWGTYAENMADMSKHYRQRRTECVNGHDITKPGSLYENGRSRKCKICARARTKANRLGVADYRDLLAV
jgi:hypothetical protein